MEKSRRIELERQELLKLLGLDIRKKRASTPREALIRRTVNDLAFMRIELDDIQEILSADGWQDEYQNGENQGGTKQNPAAKTFLDIQKLYNSTVKHLNELAGKQEAPSDELMEFLKR